MPCVGAGRHEFEHTNADGKHLSALHGATHFRFCFCWVFLSRGEGPAPLFLLMFVCFWVFLLMWAPCFFLTPYCGPGTWRSRPTSVVTLAPHGCWHAGAMGLFPFLSQVVALIGAMVYMTGEATHQVYIGWRNCSWPPSFFGAMKSRRRMGAYAFGI